MGNRGRSENHGPEGDPSWLGGKDRGGAGVGSGRAADEAVDQGARSDSGGWPSDFSSDAAQSADGRGMSEEFAPRFGEFTDEQAQSDRSSRRHQGKPSAKELLSALLSIVVMVVIAFTFYRSGWNAWWLIFVIGIPLARRISHLASRYFGD